MSELEPFATTSGLEDRAGVVAPPPLIYLATLLLGFALEWRFPLPRLPSGLRMLGALLALAGVTFGLAAIRTLRRAATNVNPYRPTVAIVQEGPYRWTRNPIYLSFTLLYLGISALAGVRWPLFLLPLALGVVQLGVIAREEAYLARKFGEPYERYRRQVRRWI